MNDDRTRTVPPPADAAVTTGGDAPVAVRPDFNSRIETRLWQLHKGDDRAEARMCVKYGRREFRVYVNGGLWWSRNYGIDDQAHFDVDAAAKQQELLGLGWTLV